MSYHNLLHVYNSLNNNTMCVVTGTCTLTHIHNYTSCYILILIIVTVTYCKKCIIGNKHYHYQFELLVVVCGAI